MPLGLLHQVGHNANWNIESFQNERCGDGLILSPLHQAMPAVEKLDAEFERYLVWFRVLKPTDPRIQTSEARKKKPVDGDISPQDKQWYLERIDYLKTQYERAGMLSQNDRQKNLSALRKAINLR